MAKQHVVSQGDCISSIAFANGFFPDTIWNHPSNAELKDKRKNPNVLLPGDVVNIPDPTPKEESRPTGKLHKFKRKGVPAKLHVVLEENGEPIAGQPYEVTFDVGGVVRGVTSGAGDVSVPVAPNAHRATLVVGQGENRREYVLQLGHLDPVDTVQGVQDRLKNLGFGCGEEDGTVGPETKRAVRAFRSKNGLPDSDEIDGALRSKLTELHGS